MNKKVTLILTTIAVIAVALIVWKFTYRFGFIALVFAAGLYIGYRWGKGAGDD